jgi:hypothetical protein
MEESNKIQVTKKQQSGLTILPKELAQVLETGELLQNLPSLVPAKSYECKKLSSMIKEHSTNVYLAIEMLLANLAMQVNVKFNLEPHQAPGIAQTIYKQYYFYSIEEIALVLRMGSEGVLIDEKGSGKIYDRLSKDVIMVWFVIYDSRHRAALVENTRSNLNKEYEKMGQENKEAMEKISAMWGKIAKAMDEETDSLAKKEKAYQEAKRKYFEDKKNGNINLK